MHDRRPAVIARPRSAQDVAAAIRYARTEGLLIAGPERRALDARAQRLR